MLSPEAREYCFRQACKQYFSNVGEASWPKTQAKVWKHINRGCTPGKNKSVVPFWLFEDSAYSLQFWLEETITDFEETYEAGLKDSVK